MSAPQGWTQTAPSGVSALVVPLQKVDGKAELMQVLVHALSLPSDFGRNWDALYDALTDLSADTALEFSGQSAFAQAHAELWQSLEGVLLDAQGFLGEQGVKLYLVK